MDAVTPDEGGKGVEYAPTLTTRQTSDTRLVERAVRERWNIPPHIRSKLPEIMAGIVESGASERNKIAAGRVILSADALNMEQEKRDAGGEHVNVHHDIRGLTDAELDARIAAAQGGIGRLTGGEGETVESLPPEPDAIGSNGMGEMPQ